MLPVYLILIPTIALLIRKVLIFRNKIPRVFVSVSLSIFIFAILLFCSTILLSKYNLYWHGYQSTRWIYIFLAFSSLLFFWIHTTHPSKRYLTVISGIITFILVGTGAFVLNLMLAEYRSQLFYSDNKYRLEEVFYGLGSPKLPKLFVKKGLLEKAYIINQEYDDPSRTYPAENHISKEQIIKIDVKEIENEKVSITFYHSADTNWIRKNPLNFIVETR